MPVGSFWMWAVRWPNRRKDAVPISAYRRAPDDDADRADHLDRHDRVAELN
jgi:hypothetical protein